VAVEAKGAVMVHGTRGVAIMSDRNSGAWSESTFNNKLAREIAGIGRPVLATIGAGVGIVSSALAAWFTPLKTVWAAPGFIPDPYAKYKRGVQLAMMGVRAYSIANAWGAEAAESEGNIAMHAAGKTMVMGSAAQVYGAQVAALDSLVMCSVNAVGFTSISGGLYAGMTGGLQATVQGLKDADLTAVIGAARLRGRDEVEVSSAGRVAVTGGSTVQVDAARQVQVHGSVQGVWIGAGVGVGTAMTLKPTGITLGCSTQATFGSSVFTNTKLSLAPLQALMTTAPGVKVALGKEKVDIAAAATKLTVSAIAGVKIDGMRVMLG
jgi:hypothetical protein